MSSEEKKKKKAADPYFRKRHYQDREVANAYDGYKIRTATQQRDYDATERTLEGILRLVPPQRTVLDCPAGTGRLIEAVLRHGFKYVGVDVSHEMLQVAREKIGDARETAHLLRGDATGLPFVDGTFDAVLVFKFVSLLPESVQRAVLREFARVCGRHLVVQSKHLRTADPVHGLKYALSRCLGLKKRVEKYVRRAALPKLIEESVAVEGLVPLAKPRIVTAWWRTFWPFGLEYMLVFERPAEPDAQPQPTRVATTDRIDRE